MLSEGIMTLASLASIFVVGSIGYSRGTVDGSGLISGILVGSIFALAGGYSAVIMLLTFFLLGSIFTKYRYSYKEEIGAAEPRGGARGWRSVFSNLLFPSLALLLYQISDDRTYLLAFLSSLSCSLADTLASELGPLDGRGARMITDLRRVPHGTSGAISILGTISSLLGSFIIPLEALLFSMVDLTALLLASTLGFLSSVVDSLLGATLQARFICDGLVIEDPSSCQGRAIHLSGIPWIDNHSVNLISTGFGFLMALILGECVL